MKPSHYLGIDPGHSGGIALLNAAGTTCCTWDMPTRKHGTVVEIDLPPLYDILTQALHFPVIVAGLEWPSAWPGTFGNVARDATAFGKGLGTLDAILWAMGFDYRRVPPQQWKQRLGLVGKSWDAKSEQGHALWLREYPQHADRVTGSRGGLKDGLLDACLIAHYLRIGGEAPCGHRGGKRPACFRGVGKELFSD